MFLRAADFIEDGRTVSFRLKLKGKEEYSTSSVHVGESSLSAHFDIYATVESWTSDSYKHFTSMATYLGDYKHYYSAFDDTGTDFDVINWLEELSEMADDEFGTQAGVQIYSNIDGGLGHFGVQSRMYVSDQYYVTLNNN